MHFNGWKITIKYDGKYEVVTNDDTLIIVDEEYDVALALKYLEGFMKISHVNYGSDFWINAETKEIILEIRNPYQTENH